MNLNEVIWSQKYRPHTIKECILPVERKKLFQSIVDDGKVINMILSGSSGVGKTSAALAMLEELDVDYIVINGSMNGNIDTLRNEIQSFATTVSLIRDQRKAVVLDEADFLTATTQAALRNFIETYSSNCSFILTCNSINKLLDALKSRCSVIDFSIPKKEKTNLLKEMVVKCKEILDNEGVACDLKALAAIISKFYPDFRKTINTLQEYAKTGPIDTGILAGRASLDDLVKILEQKKFSEMISWVFENNDLDFAIFSNDLYKKLSSTIDSSKLPYLVTRINEFDAKNAIVSNKELNIASMLTFLMDEIY